AAKGQLPDPDTLEQRARLTWPRAIIQLIERDDTTPRHPWQDVLEGNSRRLVEVEVQKEQAHDKMLVSRDEVRNRLGHVAADQFNLRHVTEKTIGVVFVDELTQLLVR